MGRDYKQTDFRLLQMPQNQSRMVLELCKTQQFHLSRHLNGFMAMGFLFSSLCALFHSQFHFCCLELSSYIMCSSLLNISKFSNIFLIFGKPKTGTNFQVQPNKYWVETGMSAFLILTTVLMVLQPRTQSACRAAWF